MMSHANGAIAWKSFAFRTHQCVTALFPAAKPIYRVLTRLLTARWDGPWRQIAGTVGVINYTIPFQGKQNATMKMDILYMTGGVLDYVVSLKRTYLTLDTFMESYGVAVRFNASKLIPGLPF